VGLTDCGARAVGCGLGGGGWGLPCRSRPVVPSFLFFFACGWSWVLLFCWLTVPCCAVLCAVIITDAVQAQLLNSTGCPIYCIDLRNQSWIQDGCMCNLDRVKVREDEGEGGWAQGGAAWRVRRNLEGRGGCEPMLEDTCLLLPALKEYAQVVEGGGRQACP